MQHNHPARRWRLPLVVGRISFVSGIVVAALTTFEQGDGDRAVVLLMAFVTYAIAEWLERARVIAEARLTGAEFARSVLMPNLEGRDDGGVGEAASAGGKFEEVSSLRYVSIVRTGAAMIACGLVLLMAFEAPGVAALTLAVFAVYAAAEARERRELLEREREDVVAMTRFVLARHDTRPEQLWTDPLWREFEVNER